MTADPRRTRTLRIRVTEAGQERVNIAIPLALAHLGKVKLGGLVRGQLTKFGVDLEEALRQVEQTGRGLTIANGTGQVEISVD